MTTNFPTSVDSFPDPLATDRLDNPPHDVLHTDINSAVEAIETALLDGAPLHIDDVNERVGVGTTSPSTELEVAGTVTATEFVGHLQGPTHIRVKNTSGGSLSKGTPVYATGSVGASGAVEVQASLAGTASTMPALGLLDETLADNAQGSATILGVIRQVDTSSYSVNDSLYVSTSGGLTNVRPTGASELVQKIGRVIRVNASSGEVLVLGAGRANDVPNNIVAGGLTIDTDTLHVDSTNNRVGIGTTSPAELLHIQDGSSGVTGHNTQAKLIVESSSDATIEIATPNTGNAYLRFIDPESNARGGISYAHSSDVMKLRTAGSDKITIDSSGNVGIGTTTPAAQLEISNTGSGQIYATGDGFYVDQNGSQLDALFLRSQGPVQLSSNLDGGTSNDYIQFLTAAGTERMRINALGNVGIGTTAPESILHLAPETNVTPNADGVGHLTIDGAGYTGFASLDGSGMWVGHNSALRSLYLATNETERLTIDGNGRVGVGGNPSVQPGAEYMLFIQVGSNGGLNIDYPTTSTTQGLAKGYSNVGGTDTLQFIIRTDGDFQSRTNSYGGTSDATIKQDIVDAPSQWDDIKAVQLRKYRLIDDVVENGDNAVVQLGVVAQELEAAGMAGLVVDGDPNDPDKQHKSVKYSVLLLKALGALQEAMVRIEALEAT
jgi:hypothetical protein